MKSARLSLLALSDTYQQGIASSLAQPRRLSAKNVLFRFCGHVDAGGSYGNMIGSAHRTSHSLCLLGTWGSLMRVRSSRRYFATDTATTLTTSLHWRRHCSGLMDRLLSIPLGSLTPALWKESIQTINDDPTGLFVVLDQLLCEVKSPTPKSTRSGFQPMPASELCRALSENFRLQQLSPSFASRSSKTFTRSTSSSSGLTPDKAWEKLKQYAAHDVACLNGYTYSIIIESIGKTYDAEKAPLLAEMVLSDALKLARNYPMTCKHPGAQTMNRMLHLWSNSGRPEAPDVAQRHWAAMLEWGRTRVNCRPTRYTYACMIDVWAVSSRPEASKVAEQFLGDMEARMGCAPDIVVHNVVLKALAKSGRGERAHELLQKMIKRNQEDPRFASGSKNGFGIAIATVLEAYYRSGDILSMQAVIKRMESLAKETGNQAYQPDNRSYNSLMNAFASRGRTRKAELLLEKMATSTEDRSRPNEITWNLLLKAYANSTDPQAVDRIHAILESVQEFDHPRIEIYNAMLSYYSNNASYDNGVLAESLLKEMKEKGVIDESSYSSVLRLWGKAGYPERAQTLLEELCMHHNRSDSAPVAPEAMHFNAVMEGWSYKGGDESLARLSYLLKTMDQLHQSLGLKTRPNTASYNIYLECLLRSLKEDAVEQADNFLRSLCSRSQGDGTSPPPNVKHFATVISAWARSQQPDGAARILSLVELMKNTGVSPDYDRTISALAHMGNPDAAQRLFDEMCKENNKPDFITRSTLLLSWGKVGNPDRANATLDGMIEEFQAGNGKLPLTQDFNFVLEAWRNSNRQDACGKIENTLENMKAFAASGRTQVQPDLYSYCTAISALISSGSTDESISIRIIHFLNEMDHVDSKRWRTQAPTVYRQIKSELSQSCLSRKAEHLSQLDKLMDRHQANRG